MPHHRFTHIHVDLVGTLPPSRSHTYLFTVIDRTSWWPEAIPLTSITAADCARALFANWVSRSECRPPLHPTKGSSSRPPCLKLWSAHSWSYRASSSTLSTPPNHRRCPSSKICRPPWLAAHHRRRGTTWLQLQHLYQRTYWQACPSRQRRCTAAVGPCLRRSLPSIGAVDTFLSPADRRENGQDLNATTQAGQKPADTEPAQPPCRGCSVAQAPPAHEPPPPQWPRGRPRQVTFTLHPTTPPSTTATSSSGTPLHNIRLPVRLNLWACHRRV